MLVRASSRCQGNRCYGRRGRRTADPTSVQSGNSSSADRAPRSGGFTSTPLKRTIASPTSMETPRAAVASEAHRRRPTSSSRGEAA